MWGVDFREVGWLGRRFLYRFSDERCEVYVGRRGGNARGGRIWFILKVK